MHHYQQRSQQLLSQNIACLVEDFKYSQKLAQAHCETLEKNKRLIQLRKEIITEKGLNIHLLSPGISSNTFAYPKLRKISCPTLHLLLFFCPCFFSVERDPSCCLSQREGQIKKMRERRKTVEKLQKEEQEKIRCESWKGWEGKGSLWGYQSKNVGDLRRNKTWEPQAHFALKSLKASNKGCVSSPSSTHSWKMSSNYYNQVLYGGKCYWQLITLCIKIYVRVHT